MSVTRYVIDKPIELAGGKVYECTEDAVPEAITQKCVSEVWIDDQLVLVRPSSQGEKMVVVRLYDGEILHIRCPKDNELHRMVLCESCEHGLGGGYGEPAYVDCGYQSSAPSARIANEG